MNTVEVIARTLDVESGMVMPDGEGPSELAVRIARAVLFDLAKSGVRLVEPGDVLHEIAHVDEGTVSVLLRAG